MTCSRCKPGRVSSVVIAGGKELCSYCRSPLSDASKAEFEEDLKMSRSVTKRIGGIPKVISTCGGNNEVGDLPPEYRSRDTRHDSHLSDSQVERQYADRIAACRAEGGRIRGSGMRHLASIPAEDYFGRINATGDKNYWDDKENLSKHKAYLVDHD